MINKEKLNNFIDEFDSIEVKTNSFDNILNDFNISKPTKKSDLITRKFEETFSINDYEIFTDSGWSKIKNIGKTIPYEIYDLKTKYYNHNLKCADDHIVFTDGYDEVYVKDLNKDSRPDKIITIDGPDTVEYVTRTGIFENMYDLEVDSEDHRYWTNNILSHNSIWLANDAVNFSKEGKNVSMISAEMEDKLFIKRLGSNYLNIRMDEYDSKSRDARFMKDRLSNKKGGMVAPGALFVKEYPTSQVTVPEIETYLRELELSKGLKLDVIVIDYINILANYRNVNTENTYMKIKQIAEDLRAMAVRNNWLIITATQITRSGYESSEITMSHVAESAGLSHTADMMYGIVQTPQMFRDREYWLKILKIRNGRGKNFRKKYNIMYDYMRLVELDEMVEGEEL